MGRLGECEPVLSKSKSELFLFVAFEIQIGGPSLQFQARGPGAGVAPRQLRKFHDRAGSNAQRAAVFEFNLSPGVLPGAQFRALGDGQIDESFFVALAGVAVDLNVAIHLAQAHDASLGVGKRWDGQPARQDR